MYYQPKVIYRDPKQPRNNSIIRYISNRVLRENTNFNCAITGLPGKGKSYSAISIAEMYSAYTKIPFDVNIHVIHSVKQLLALIKDRDLNKNIQNGSILVLEEAQAEANSRNWQSQINKIMNSLFATFRNQRLVVLITVPYLQFIDKQTRILMNAEFKVLGFDKNTGLTKIRPHFLEYYPPKDKFYTKSLIVEYAIEGKSYHMSDKLGKWIIPKASKELLTIYEQIKKAFSDRYNEKLWQQTLQIEEKEQPKSKNIDFQRLEQLYKVKGDNYYSYLNDFPEHSLTTITQYINSLKKSYKAAKIEPT